MLIYIGIDPGQKGGVSFVDDCGLNGASFPMPDAPQELKDLLKTWGEEHQIVHVYLEKAHAMPKQGVTSMFTYGHHNGTIEGILITLEVPYTLVPPKEWQKEMFLGAKIKALLGKTDPKQRALEIVRRLYPKESFLASLRCKKPHDGMIDSRLIAEYCRRKII